MLIRVCLSNMYFVLLIWYNPAIHEETTFVTCSLKVIDAWRIIPKSLAWETGDIYSPKETWKFCGTWFNIWRVPNKILFVLCGFIRWQFAQHQVATLRSSSVIKFHEASALLMKKERRSFGSPTKDSKSQTLGIVGKSRVPKSYSVVHHELLGVL